MRTRSFITILLCFNLPLLTAQVFEHHEDRSYRNRYSDVVNLGDSVWVVSGNYNVMSSFFSGAYLKGFDTNGMELWNYDTPLDTEYRAYSRIEVLPNGQWVTFGVEQFCCDCSMPFLQMSWHNSEGQLLNQVNFESIEYWLGAGQMRACQSANLLCVVYDQGWPSISYVLATDFTGDSLWTIQLGEVLISHLIAGNSTILAFSDTKLFRMDETGSVLDSIGYAVAPIDACSAFNERPFVMWSDGVYEVLENGTLDLVIPNAMGVSALGLFRGNDRLFVRYDNAILHYDSEFELVMTTPYNDLPNWEYGGIAANHSSFAMVGARHIQSTGSHAYRGAAIHTIDFSGNQLDHFPDLALTNVGFSELNIQEAQGLGGYVYEVTGEISGYFVNEGDVEINSAYVNYLSSSGLCNQAGVRQQYSNLGLAPGDSVVFTISNIFEIMGLSADSQAVSFCVFLSDPSNYYDRNAANDQVCFSHMIYVGVEENELEVLSAYPNPTRDRIRFEFSGESISGQLFVFNQSGTLITDRFLAGAYSVDIDVSDWNAGLYIARVVNDGKASAPIKFAVVK